MSLVDYSDMEKEIAEAPEPTVLKKGSEVKARIIKVNSGIVDNGGDYDGFAYNSVVYDVPDEALAKEFSDFFWELDKKLPPKDYARAIAKFKNFAAAFGVDYSKPFDWEDDLIGLEGWVIVGIKKSDEYGDQNTVQKYLYSARGKNLSKGTEDPF